MKNSGQYHWLILYKWKHETFKAVNTCETQCRSNFYSIVGSRRSGGTTMAPLFSRIHTSLINIWTTISQALVWVWLQWENKMEHLTTYLHIPRTTKYTHTHIYICMYVCMYVYTYYSIQLSYIDMFAISIERPRH